MALIAASSPSIPEPLVASGSGDGEVKFWKQNGDLLGTFPHPSEKLDLLPRILLRIMLRVIVQINL